MRIAIGAAVRLYTTETDDVGIVHAPPPVEPGAILALEHWPPLRVRSVLALEPGGHVQYVAEVVEARGPRQDLDAPGQQGA